MDKGHIIFSAALKTSKHEQSATFQKELDGP